MMKSCLWHNMNLSLSDIYMTVFSSKSAYEENEPRLVKVLT